jgi:hypothetical protein
MKPMSQFQPEVPHPLKSGPRFHKTFCHLVLHVVDMLKTYLQQCFFSRQMHLVEQTTIPQSMAAQRVPWTCAGIKVASLLP